MVIAILIICSVLTAGVAAHKGRNPLGWGAVGFCLGFIGLLIASLQDPLLGSNELQKASPGPGHNGVPSTQFSNRTMPS
ncbi:MAG TPA: hypothetical protein VGM90_02685 [Kofleriaceae bacterium]|jgi:hypothetical protein